jgi:hypothetical protein
MTSVGIKGDLLSDSVVWLEQNDTVQRMATTNFECSELRTDDSLCWVAAGVEHCMTAKGGSLAIVDTGLSPLGERTMSWVPEACFSEATARLRLVLDPPISNAQFAMRLHPSSVADRVTLICWVDVDYADDDSVGVSWSPSEPMGPDDVVGIGVGLYPHMAVCDFVDAEADNILVNP